MKPSNNLLKKVIISFVLLFVFSPILEVSAQSNGYICGNTASGPIICNQSLSQQSWGGKSPCEVTTIEREGDRYVCNENVLSQCSTGTFPNLMSTFKEMISGVTRVNSEGICENINANSGVLDPKTVAENVSFEDGLTTALLNGTGYMYQTPPIEPFRIYAKKNFDEVMSKINILDTANAQEETTVFFPGMGTNLLSPIRSIWNVMRNLAYGFLILIVFFISLMILFRRQLNGDQIVTLMNSLPSLVLSMVLITFSYGISGVFLDLIPIGSNFIQYVLVGNPTSPGYNTIWNSHLIRTNDNLVFYTGGLDGEEVNIDRLLEQIGLDPNDRDWDQVLTPDAITEGKYAVQYNDEYMSIWQIWGTANPSVFNNINSLRAARGEDEPINFNIVPDESILQNSGVIQNVASGFANLLGRNTEGTISNSVQNAAGILIDLVFSFAALIATFRLFMSLLRAYLTLILLPAVSPIIFLLAGIPSLTSSMIGMFVRNMLGASLSFVAVYAVFLVVIILAYENFVQNSTFIPPLLGYTEQSNLNMNGGIIKALAAYGLFLMTPIIPQKIQEALQAGGESAFGQAVSEGTQQGVGTAMMLGNMLNSQFKKIVSPKDA